MQVHPTRLVSAIAAVCLMVPVGGCATTERVAELEARIIKLENSVKQLEKPRAELLSQPKPTE